MKGGFPQERADWLSALREGLTGLGRVLSAEQARLFATYLAYLRSENEHLNLTTIVEPVEVAIKHFVDSATVLKATEIDEGDALIDVGSGAGFPGVPVAILRPDLRVTLVEAVRKKAAFLERLVGELELPQVSVVVARAEELGRAKEHRERYGLATARAVASLPALWEYLLPLVRVGGGVAALKGPGVAEELPPARRAAQLLGGGEAEVRPFVLPGEAGERRIVVVRKISPTPKQYPRRVGVPAKTPL